MRLIDADALKNELSDKDYITYTHEYGDAIPVDWIMSAIDNAPTASTVCSTRIASIVDQFGNRIEGYFDESRMLFFSGYGIVTAELIKQKNYKLIFEEEQFRPNCGADMRGGKE